MFTFLALASFFGVIVGIPYALISEHRKAVHRARSQALLDEYLETGDMETFRRAAEEGRKSQ